MSRFEGVEVWRSNLGGMLEASPMEPWIAVNLPLLRLALACMACMWVLMAAFERETQRWKWAWSQPRKPSRRSQWHSLGLSTHSAQKWHC